MEVYVAREALECVAESIVYMRSDLSEFFKKGHMYEVLKLDDGIVHIIDHEVLERELRDIRESGFEILFWDKD